MKLTKRLTTICELIDKGAKIVDIGTDHGLIPVYLAKNDTASLIIASDSSAASLEAARKNACKHGVSDKLKLVVAEGLSGVSPGEVDTVVIAGLGGETIVGILAEAIWLSKYRGVKLILQPQTKVDIVYQWLRENGYRIREEKETVDRGRSYKVMKAVMSPSILITAGGTSERIDDVRMITNYATGRLGSVIADEFYEKASAAITYLCAENALLPKCKTAETIKIRSATDLTEKLSELLVSNKYDAVVHTMAVSDYHLSGVTDIASLSALISKEINKADLSSHADKSIYISKIIQSALRETAPSAAGKKIGSDIEGLMFIMERSPKAISLVKSLQPNTCLVGFKLLTNVSQDELLRVGIELMKKNNCDYILANDLKHVGPERHEGILISPDFTYVKLGTKQEIAAAIVTAVLEHRCKE